MLYKGCLYCQESLDGKRKNTKYCNDKCRMAFKRGVSITAKKTPEEIRDLKWKEMQNQTGKEDMAIIDENGETLKEGKEVFPEVDELEPAQEDQDEVFKDYDEMVEKGYTMNSNGYVVIDNQLLNFGLDGETMKNRIGECEKDANGLPEKECIERIRRETVHKDVKFAKKYNNALNLVRDEKRFGKMNKEEAKQFMQDYEDSQPSEQVSRTKHLKAIELKMSGAYCDCIHCGERFCHRQSGNCPKYCDQCKSKKERDYIDKLNYCIDIINN